jgi:dihydrofolate reductase
MRKINLIVACGVGNQVIGDCGDMPWHIPMDLKYFKARTKNQIVIMGRNTYESIGKALPGRLNFVITSKDSHNIEDNHSIIIYKGLKSAIKSAATFKDKEIFIIGGASVYKQCMELPIDKLYVTWVKPKNGSEIINGDTFFPEINKDRFKVIDSYDYNYDDNYYLKFETMKSQWKY